MSTTDFSSVRNHTERAVFDTVQRNATRWPGLQGDAELLADVACVALNRLPPRYIRHAVDFSFYLTEQARLQIDQAIVEAVAYAFNYVSARLAMRAQAA